MCGTNLYCATSGYRKNYGHMSAHKAHLPLPTQPVSHWFSYDYPKSGTGEISARYCSLCAYARAVRCPVRALRMVLSALRMVVCVDARALMSGTAIPYCA
eukprot:2780818-Rhodomonas_salina.1